MSMEDFDWLPNIDDPLDFSIGQTYHIKSGNNWETMEYVGFDPKHKVSFRDRQDGLTYPVFMFKNKYGTSNMSQGHVEDLARKGMIKFFDPEFNFYKELNIKKVGVDTNGFPMIKSDFVILFKNGINVESTYELQKKLLEMGYQWYVKGKRLITPKDVKEDIFTIESLNWDTSNNLYSRMDSTFGDRKIIMLSTMENKETEQDKERRLNFIHDHPRVQVINGDDLISKI
jgi:hypothetical protein